MSSIGEIFTKLTANNIPINAESLIKNFAGEMGWSPSYFMSASTEEFANGHLIVENGLENTAVLSFLNKPYYELSYEEHKKLLNISYNNLVDWHIPIDTKSITYLYNRGDAEKRIIEESRIERDKYDNLRSEAFQKIISRKPNSNIPSLDNVLIQTISNWKRIIYAEFPGVSNTILSNLFNAIMFIRAIEDNHKRYQKLNVDNVILSQYHILEEAQQLNIINLLETSLLKLGVEDMPTYLLDLSILNPINSFNKIDLYRLIKDFYINQYNSYYSYDFSIMSKHAISKIYEKYVSILQVEETLQLAMFPKIPIESINKAFGAFYTPQYLTRFFSRYIQNSLSHNQFTNIKILEPSVGSGIFLRTIAELQLELIAPAFDQQINKIYSNLYGIDIDENACQASKLSLSLLYLLLKNEFPPQINIVNADTIEYILENKEFNNFDVVISNPPFIRPEQQNNKRKIQIKEYLNGDAKGKADEYLAFLKLGLDLLKPGGLGLYILPYSFLLNSSASILRKRISEECNIKFIADLSAIQVFGDTGVYVILLVFQKRAQNFPIESNVRILKCRNFVGNALEDVLKGNILSNQFYDIHEIDQISLNENEWILLPGKEYRLNKKLSSLPKLDSQLDIKSGIISGNDPVFLVDKLFLKLTKSQEKILVPLMSDREMQSYKVNSKVEKHIIYPFIDGKKLDINTLKEKYPTIYDYLNKRKSSLIKSQKENWWELHRARNPKDILSPKIMTPYLSIAPKFSIDLEGKYAVSHGTFIKLKDDEYDTDKLIMFLGIMNSTPFYWYLSSHSHKVNNQYNKLEAKTLKNVPIPDIDKADKRDLFKLIKLVKERLNSTSNDSFNLEVEIDAIVCKLYGLTDEEIKILHGEY
jgi:hypothetical protein